MASRMAGGGGQQYAGVAAAATMLEPGAVPLPIQAAPPGIAAMSQEQHSGAEFTHREPDHRNSVVTCSLRNTLAVCAAFADCVEALPPSITRSISDLRELDAVLSGSLGTITDKLNRLLDMLEQPLNAEAAVMPEERLLLLKEIAEEARSFRLGGEDKIRVATGTCETVGICTHLHRVRLADTVEPPLVTFSS